MNLIVCDQNCRHQKEGYCALNQITQLTSDINAKCGYFEVENTGHSTQGHTQYSGASAEYIQSL